MPRSESASASTQLGAQLAPSGPSEASPSAPSGGRAEREDVAAVELCGRRQPLEPPFGAQRHPGSSVRVTSVSIDDAEAFRNKRFESTRELIRCVVSESEHRDVIEADFFKDLTGRPFGKKLIRSVIKYLERVEALPRKYNPGRRADYAKKVRERLDSDGLNEERVKSYREQYRELLATYSDLESEPDT